jgi:nitroreductase
VDEVSVLSPANVELALRRAAVQATLAPSVHNTQPWRFVLSEDALDLYADPDRQLRVLDPTGRQMLVSCGCAVLNARASLAASGYQGTAELFPAPEDRTLVARLTGRVNPSPDSDPLAALDAVAELRRTNRRRFADDPVPDVVVDSLVAAAEVEQATLVPIRREEDRIAVAILQQRADREQNSDPAYRAELRAWTTDDPNRDDGVPAMAVPRGGVAQDDVPVRDFDTRGTGALPTETHSSAKQCMVLIGTAADDAVSWVRGGQALERVLLEITRHGFVANTLTQAVEVPVTREGLRSQLRLNMYPHVLLRIGRAPATPAPRRRRLVDMLTEAK